MKGGRWTTDRAAKKTWDDIFQGTGPQPMNEGGGVKGGGTMRNSGSVELMAYEIAMGHTYTSDDGETLTPQEAMERMGLGHRIPEAERLAKEQPWSNLCVGCGGRDGHHKDLTCPTLSTERAEARRNR